MSVKLNNTKNRIIPAKEMRDGQMGIIFNEENVVVQAYYGSLVKIGEPGIKGWSDKEYLTDDFLVRLLEPGDTITVVSN